MIVHRVLSVCVVLMACAFMQTAGAVEISYNANNRPVEFLGLEFGGRTWTVTVNWDGTMRDTYERNGVFVPPMFFGDAAAQDAAVAMQQALIADGFTNTSLDPFQGSYLWVPQELTTHYNGPGVWLHDANLVIANVGVNYDTGYRTVGFTVFGLFKDGFESPEN